MTMSTRDYWKLVGPIRESWLAEDQGAQTGDIESTAGVIAIENLVTRLCYVLKEDNYRFDERKFREAIFKA